MRVVALIICLGVSYVLTAQSDFGQARELLQQIKTKSLSKDSIRIIIARGLRITKTFSGDSARQLSSEFLWEKSNLEYQESHYKQAIADGMEALSLAEKLNNKKLLHKCLFHLGNCYAKIGAGISELDGEDNREEYLGKSKRYLSKAWQIAKSLQDTTLITESLTGISNYFVSLQNYDSALWYSQLLLSKTNKSNHKVLSATYNYMGIIRYQQKDFIKAEDFFNLAITEAKQVSKSLTLNSAMGNLANVYMEQKRYTLAISKLHELIPLNVQASRKQALSKNYITLHNIYKRQKIYDSALYYYEKYFSTRDSILNDQHKMAILELEAKYEGAKKDSEIAALQMAKVESEAAIRKRNLWLTIAIATLLVVSMGFAFYSRQRILRQQQLHAEIQQRLLSAQMNPHFLFNSLNSIQRLYVEGRIEEGNIFMSRFAQFVRDILNKTARTKIPLHEELEFIEAYLDLEKKRLGERFDYKIIVADGLRHSEAEVPALISQPLVENSLIHGILTKVDKGTIEIEVKKDLHGQIIFQVRDNGIGYATSLEKKGKAQHSSKGLELIRTRLGKKGKLIIESLLGQTGTIATLQLQSE